MQHRWYSIQINIPSTKEINPKYLQDHKFWCILLAKHPQYSKKSDEHSRLWPDWYEYSSYNKTNQILFDNKVLIRPNVKP